MRQKCGGFLWREGRSIRRSARWREEKRKVASEMAGSCHWSDYETTWWVVESNEHKQQEEP